MQTLRAAMETESSSRISPAAARCVADVKDVGRVSEKETLLLNFQCFIFLFFWVGGRILEAERLSDISFSGNSV